VRIEVAVGLHAARFSEFAKPRTPTLGETIGASALPILATLPPFADSS